MTYTSNSIEAKWQAAWEKAGLFKAQDKCSKPKYYVLEMFPYPSGRIHIGHVRNYAMGDVIARYKRAQGYNVLHPMGFDAFGMPAENAAMKQGGHPATWTYDNIQTMTDQMKPLGFSIDWSRMFATCDPAYYGQQQSLFLDFMNAGLVTRKTSEVNWDPVDNTVLANEQVVDGCGWRSGAKVEKRQLTQWFMTISDMAEELLNDIDGLKQWPENVKQMQRNWIGKSEGVTYTFDVAGSDETIEVYTTRPDTFPGASFVAIAHDHPIAQKAAQNDPTIKAFCDEVNDPGLKSEAWEAALLPFSSTKVRRFRAC